MEGIFRVFASCYVFIRTCMVSHDGNRRVFLEAFPAMMRLVSQRLFSAGILGALIRDDADFITDPPPSLIREVRACVRVRIVAMPPCVRRAAHFGSM
jgi:hypothetical protein